LVIELHRNLSNGDSRLTAENAMLKRLSLSLLVVAIATTKLHAADGSFEGKWKLNPEKNTTAKSPTQSKSK
jgi:hypothetical protein